MPKKINLFFLLISCLLFCSFSPSLDGRAVVADSAMLPEGYFAKTVGYLPGDSILVSNFAAGKTIDILVVGSLDQSEGVAILLSPEAAAALGIVKNSNVIVKLTKRSGELDEAVSGTAVIAQGKPQPSSAMEVKGADEDMREGLAGEIGRDEHTKQADTAAEEVEAPTEETDAAELIADASDGSEQAEAESENDEGEISDIESDGAQSVSDERMTDKAVVAEAGDESGEYGAAETDTEREGVESVSESIIAEDEEKALADEPAAETFPETIRGTEEEKPTDEKIIAEDITEESDEISEAVTDDIPAEVGTISDERVTDEPVVTEADDENGERTREQTDIQSNALDESEAVAEKLAENEEEISSDEKIIAEDVPEAVQETSEPISEDTPPETENERGVTDEPVVTEVESDETLAPAEKKTLAESTTSDEEAIADEKIDAESPPAEVRDSASDRFAGESETPAEEKTDSLIAEKIDSDGSDEERAYSAIVLSDTDDSESVTERQSETAAEVRADESVQAESAIEQALSDAASAVSSSRDEGISGAVAAMARSYGARTAENLSSLDKGTYYVQIASLSNPSNIRETLAKYGRDYPVTLVPLASKAATQVMIGPLSVDEYAVVLERFKMYGYKDAFVRKVR